MSTVLALHAPVLEKAMYRLLAYILALLALTACANRSPLLRPDDGQLPALPEGVGGNLPVPPIAGAHRGSALIDVWIPGQDYYAKADTATPGAGGMQLASDAGELSWAIYQLPGISAEFAPDELATEISGLSGEYWLALADYAHQRWAFYQAPLSGNAEFSIFNWQNYQSPGGSFYFAVCLQDSSMLLIRSRISVQDTRPLPAPQNLAATPADFAADLSWDSYADPRASELRIYQASDVALSDAQLTDTAAPTATAQQINGLTAGTEYFFALKAWNAVDGVESAYSNVVSCTPTGGGSTALKLARAIWPRLGNREDGRGCTDLIGPEDLASVESVSLGIGTPSDLNRTSPVIGPDGKVYALSRRGELQCFTADLASSDWSFKAADHGDVGISYVCPPHAPCIDDSGNVYFVALPDKDESKRTGYLFCVNSSGGYEWKFSLGDLADDNDRPYPSLNISPDEFILAAGNSNTMLYAVKADGSELWHHDFLPSIEFYADPQVSSAGHVELPVWFSGIGIDPRTHWVSLEPADGTTVQDFRDFGGPQNLYSGLALAGGFYCYPENNTLLLIDSATGDAVSSMLLDEYAHASCARSGDSRHIFQLVPPNEMPPSWAHLTVARISAADPPQLGEVLNLILNTARLYCKPAVDGGDNVFFGDKGGTFYRVHFDAARPISSEITHQRALDTGTTYHFNSAALGDGVAYIVSEQNQLYRVGIPR